MNKLDHNVNSNQPNVNNNQPNVNNNQPNVNSDEPVVIVVEEKKSYANFNWLVFIIVYALVLASVLMSTGCSTMQQFAEDTKRDLSMYGKSIMGDINPPRRQVKAVEPVDTTAIVRKTIAESKEPTVLYYPEATSLDSFILDVRARKAQPGTAIVMHSALYRVVQLVRGGYMLRHFSDDPHYLPIFLRTDATAFVGEPLTAVTGVVKYTGPSSYTNVLGSSRQMLQFEDIAKRN